MIRTPMERRLLERMRKSPCRTLEEIAQNQEILKAMFSQIYAAPIVYYQPQAQAQAQQGPSGGTNSNVILAYQELDKLIASPIAWAVSTGIKVVPAAANGWIGIVGGKRAANKKGENPEVIEHRFYLVGREGVDYDLPAGDTFMYLIDTNGERIVVDGRGGMTEYYENGALVGQQPAVDLINGTNVTIDSVDDDANSIVRYTINADSMLTEWAVTQAAPVAGEVAVKLCDDSAGTNVHGIEFNAILPQRTGFNDYIPIGSVIAIERASDDTYSIESDYSCGAVLENDVLVGVQPKRNFVDTATLTWDIVEDAANSEIEIKANVIADDTQPWIQFTLTTAMSGGSATADVDDFWNGPNPGASVTVHDRHNHWRQARAADAGAGRDGAHGLAHWDFTNDAWVIVECQSLAGWVHGKMLANMAGTPLKGSFQVDGYGGTQEDMQGPGTTIDVYAVTGLTDDLLTDDYTFAVLNSEDGLYYAVTPRPSTSTDYRPRYCRAQHQWYKNSGNPRVSVKALTGYGGTETGAAFYVYLRSTHYGKDPNVHIGQDFLYQQDIDGEYITLDPNCYDDAIGTVKELEEDYTTSVYGTLSGGKPISGWAFQDGALNSTANGGSGKDWTTNDGSAIGNAEAPPIYIAPVTLPATTPGNALWPSDTSLAHTHTLTLTAGAITLAIDDHPDHRHKVSETYNNTFDGTGGTGIPCISWIDSHGSSPQVNYSGGAVVLGGGGHVDGDHTALTLTHSGTASAADPTGTLAATYQQVFYKRVCKIERIDNSFEVFAI